MSKRCSADVMACTYYDVHITLSMLKGFYGEDHANRPTRADQKVLEETVSPSLDEMDVVITLATAEFNEERMDTARSSVEKLSGPERLLRFLEKGGALPADELLRYCPYCKCKGTVDLPADNAVRMRRNEAKMKEWGEEIQAWEEVKAKGEVQSRFGTKGHACSRDPKLPPMEHLSIVCHYHQMWNPNPRDPDDIGRTCSIKCRDPTGKIYAYDVVRKEITCTVCLCNCTRAFEASVYQDMQAIKELDKGRTTLPRHQVAEKALADLMTDILN